jgi:hypothetical protein
MGGVTAVAGRQSLHTTPRRQPPRRAGFGTWALAVQLRLKPLGRQEQRACKGIGQSAALRHHYESDVLRARRDDEHA